jgi:hypothetical protein
MPQATIKPTKKVMKIERLAVFIEMKIGDQSTAMSFITFNLTILFHLKLEYKPIHE